MIHIDTVGFGDLARDLRKASARVGAELVPVVKKGAGNIKSGMRKDMKASRHFGQVARSINYEIDRTPASIEAAIEPDTSTAQSVGNLAHIAYFGGVNGGGDTVRDPEYHLDEEAPRFEKAVADVVDGLL